MVDILNLLSDKWLELIWRITWQGSIFIGIIFLITKIFKKLSPTIKHLLWMLVIVKFLIMPFVTVPVVLPPFPSIIHKPTAKPVIEIPILPQESDIISEPLPSLPPEQPSPVAGTYQPKITIHWQSLLFSGWLSGIIILLFGVTYRSFKLKKDISSAKALEDKDILNIVEDGVNKFRLSLPTLKISDKFKSPLACGILHPWIIFPENLIEKFTQSELEAIIYHELAHIKRVDILTNWLQILVQIIYFFNPLTWYTNRQIRIEREHACDDWVLQIGREDRKRYTDALLKVVELSSGRERFALGIVGVSETFTLMADRLKMIMNTRRKINTRFSIRIIFILIAVALIGIPAYVTREISVIAIELKPKEGNTVNVEFIQDKQTQLVAVDEERIVEIAMAHLLREKPDLKQSQVEEYAIIFGLYHEGKSIVIGFHNLSKPTTTHNKKGEPLITYPTIWVQMDITGKFIGIQKGPDDVVAYTSERLEKSSEAIEKNLDTQSLTDTSMGNRIETLQSAQEMANVCATNLHKIGIAMHLYANDHDGKFPHKLLVLKKYLEEPGFSVFRCPATDDAIENWNQVDSNTSYVYVSGLTDKDDPNTVLLYERECNHGMREDEKVFRTYLFVDAHVFAKRECK